MGRTVRHDAWIGKTERLASLVLPSSCQTAPTRDRASPVRRSGRVVAGHRTSGATGTPTENSDSRRTRYGSSVSRRCVCVQARHPGAADAGPRRRARRWREGQPDRAVRAGYRTVPGNPAHQGSSVAVLDDSARRERDGVTGGEVARRDARVVTAARGRVLVARAQGEPGDDAVAVATLARLQELAAREKGKRTCNPSPVRRRRSRACRRAAGPGPLGCLTALSPAISSKSVASLREGQVEI
jgi:hypothetical protein